MNAKETCLLVSILNTVFEKLYDEECGPFGYDLKTLELSADDSTLEEELQTLWTDLCIWIKTNSK